jgi:hypothetical protein
LKTLLTQIYLVLHADVRGVPIRVVDAFSHA